MVTQQPDPWASCVCPRPHVSPQASHHQFPQMKAPWNPSRVHRPRLSNRPALPWPLHHVCSAQCPSACKTRKSSQAPCLSRLCTKLFVSQTKLLLSTSLIIWWHHLHICNWHHLHTNCRSAFYLCVKTKTSV